MGHHKTLANFIPKCSQCIYSFINLGHNNNIILVPISQVIITNSPCSNGKNCVKSSINRCLKFNNNGSFESVEDCRNDYNRCGPSGRFFEKKIDLGPVV